MIYCVTYIKDFIGNNYLGIIIPNGVIQPFLNKLNQILGNENYNKYTSNQQNRDSGDYHITVINVMEYNKLSKDLKMDKFINSLTPILNFEFNDIKLMGLGPAERNNNRSYFVVVSSDQLQAVRKRYDLPDQDFHITLGFDARDVFGVPKNKVLEDFSPFLQLLAQNFYINENFNFVRDIENFPSELNPEDEIIPVKISKSYLTVMSGDYMMDIGWLDENKKFWIMTKYIPTEKLPRISQNEISQILKK